MTKRANDELRVELATLRQEVAKLRQEKQTSQQLPDTPPTRPDAVLADLNERVQVAQQDNEQRFRLIADVAPAPILISRLADSEIVYANAMVGPLVGLSTEALLGRKTTDFFHNRADQKQLLDALANDGLIDNYELQIKQVDGTLLWVAASLRYLEFNDEKCLLVSFYDITERKQAEDLLTEYKRTLELDVKRHTAELTQANEHLLHEIVERQRAEEALYQQNEYLAALYDTTLGLIGRLKLNDLLEGLMTRAGQLLDTSHGAIYLVDPDSLLTSPRAEKEPVIRQKIGMGIFEQLSNLTLKPNEGLVGKVWQSGQPLVVNDYDTWPGRSPNFNYGLIRAVMGVPLTHNVTTDTAEMEVVGVITMAYGVGSGRIFADEEIELLSRFAQLAFVALDNARLFEAEQHQRKMAESLREVAAVLNTSLDRDTVLAKIIEQLGRVIDYDSAVILLHDGNDLIISEIIGLSHPEAIGYRIPLSSNAPAVRAFMSQRPLAIADVQSDPGWAPFASSKPIRGWMGIPLMKGDKAIGILTVNSIEVNAYDEADLQLVQIFANHAAIAIENARLYTEAQESKKAADAANRAKSTFLANMSHELRTPLNAILGFAQLLQRETGLTSSQQENLNIINRSGEQLLTLINDILEMSKIEAGRTTLNEEDFDLHCLLGDLHKMFYLPAKDKGLTLDFDYASDVPQYVHADGGKLREVLLNLLSNALKFTQEGGVWLRATCHKADSVSRNSGRREAETQNLRLFFEVEDTGPGIASAELPGLFDPFVQTESGLNSPSGTGLGLAISRQFVELMGGEIGVDSQVGQGSLFKFDIAVVLAQGGEPACQKPERRVIGLATDEPGYRILVVEDKFESRTLLVKLLQSVGFEVEEAENGQEAVQKWQHWHPHLIWMDVRMPVMDGLEATKQIKTTAAGPPTVVIALTASAFDEDQAAIQLAGCDDFVPKPFQAGAIFEKMALHLGVRYTYDSDGSLMDDVTSFDADSHQMVLKPAALAELPARLVSDLHEATIQGEFDQLLTLIERIREQNMALAESLAALVNDFAYDKILDLIQQAGKKQ